MDIISFMMRIEHVISHLLDQQMILYRTLFLYAFSNYREYIQEIRMKDVIHFTT